MLKLSHINLGSDQAVAALEHFIDHNHMTNQFDVSHASLKAKHLLRIAQALKKSPDHIKMLNLSYNCLSDGEDFTDILEDDLDISTKKQRKNESSEFVVVMTDYFRKSTILNHLDLSGLQLIAVCLQHATDPSKNEKDGGMDPDDGMRGRKDKFSERAAKTCGNVSHHHE